MNRIILYHGSPEKVSEPEIRKSRFTKDFSWGFYCTNLFHQAKRWATRVNGRGYVNEISFVACAGLNVKKFTSPNIEWLKFIAKCRNGEIHDYDIVEGPMADDTIYNFVESYFAGEITEAAFLELARFKKPTHQISFHTLKALSCLEFIDSREVKEDASK